MDGFSLDVKNEKINALKSIFPEVFSEEKIDWERLRATLGEDVYISNERYVLNWAGKSDAFRTLQTGTSATLAPVKDESVNFDTTENVFIEGENLEVLKVLQKAYFGKIKCIIIDPPYNTGNDSFIYPDKFSETKDEYMRRVGDKDEEGYLMKEGLFRKNSKENGQYHSNWLSMMYPRLFLARNLLRDDGVIFVHIDDNEVHNLRLLMNEIFGEENFISEIVRRQNLAGKQDAKKMSIEQDYILVYSKNYESENINKQPANLDHYNLSDEFMEQRGKFYLRRMDDDGMTYSDKLNFPIYFNKGEYVLFYNDEKKICYKDKIENEIKVFPNNDERNNSFNWRWSKEKIEWGKANDLIVLKKNNRSQWQVNFKSYALVDNNLKSTKRKNPFGSLILDYPNNLSHFGVKELFDNKKYFDYPKPVGLIKHIVKIGANSNSIILDFFAGSGTTAHAVLDLNKEDGGNRKFILVQLPEKTDESSEAYKAGYKTIADICKERIRRVIKKIEDERKPKEQQKLIEEELPEMDLGFKVFKLKPSNFKQWRTDIQSVEELGEQLEAFTDPVKPEAEEENMLFELLLKSGYDLNSNIAVRDLGLGTCYYDINDGDLVLQLSGKPDLTVESIIATNPKKVIMLDRLFENNDQLKTNTFLQFKDAGVDFRTV